MACARRVRDTKTGQRETIAARYLVGCDGAAGAVASALGVGYEGQGIVANSVNVYFRAPDLPKIHSKGWARFYRFTDAGGSWGEIIGIDGKERWRLSVLKADPEFDGDGYIRRLLGRDIPYEILSVMDWERRERVADRYRDRRVFIAGDAAHQNSPTGGLGLHTGLADAVDLGWKLTAVLKGWGGEGLLDSATRPSASPSRSTMCASRPRNSPSSRTCRPARRSPRIRRAARNCAGASPRRSGAPARCGPRSSPRICGSAIATSRRPFALPTARCGRRSRRRPSFPSRGPERARRMPGSAKAAQRSISSAAASCCCGSARTRRAPRPSPRPRRRGACRSRSIDLAEPQIAALYERRLVLVRPDGHVAWRDDRPPADPLALIDTVRGA